jgi:predicted PurR-regulated permease PerM
VAKPSPRPLIDRDDGDAASPALVVVETMSLREAVARVWGNPYVRVLSALAVLYLLARAFAMVQPAGTLFVAGLGLAYLFNPVVDWLEARRIPRAVGVGLVAVGLIVVAWLVVALGLTAIRNTLTEGEEGITLTEAATTFIQDLPANMQRLLPKDLYDLVAEPVAAIAGVLRQGTRALAPYVENLGTALYGVVSGAVFGIGLGVLVLVLTVYALYDYHRLSTSLLRVWPKPYQPRVVALASTVDGIFGSYIRGQVLIATAVGLMVAGGLTLVGLPMALFIGLLAGFLNIVPFLGTIVPVIPALVIALGHGWWMVVLVSIVFVVANQIDNHVLTPVVLARSTRLHPVTVMLSVIGGFALGGIWTAIFAVPVVAFAKVLYTEHYLKTRFYREG